MVLYVYSVYISFLEEIIHVLNTLLKFIEDINLNCSFFLHALTTVA